MALAVSDSRADIRSSASVLCGVSVPDHWLDCSGDAVPFRSLVHMKPVGFTLCMGMWTILLR